MLYSSYYFTVVAAATLYSSYYFTVVCSCNALQLLQLHINLTYIQLLLLQCLIAHIILWRFAMLYSSYYLIVVCSCNALWLMLFYNGCSCSALQLILFYSGLRLQRFPAFAVTYYLNIHTIVAAVMSYSSYYLIQTVVIAAILLHLFILTYIHWMLP